MEEMILHPVIDSKYLLNVREEAHIENVQPAIVAHVIHSMEAFDLYEYEMPSSMMLKETVAVGAFRHSVTKFLGSFANTFSNETFSAEKSMMLSFSPYSPILAVEEQEEVTDFASKRLNLESILPLMQKLATVSRFERIHIMGVLEHVIIGPNFRPKHTAKVMESQNVMLM